MHVCFRAYIIWHCAWVCVCEHARICLHVHIMCVFVCGLVCVCVCVCVYARVLGIQEAKSAGRPLACVRVCHQQQLPVSVAVWTSIAIFKLSEKTIVGRELLKGGRNSDGHRQAD